MKLKSFIVIAILLVFSQSLVMAQVDPTSSFRTNSSGICDGAGNIFLIVKIDIYWTMTVYREYVTTTVSGSYTTGAQNQTDVAWTGGTFALDGTNRWTEWDKMWIGTNSSGIFATQHFIEFDCTGKLAGEAADVYICNDFAGNDPNICRTPSSSNPDEPFQFTDGRLNDYDVSTPIVVYPWENESGLGLAIYSDSGEALLFVTAAELGECPSENTLIASNESANVWVYRLSSCEYQINATQYNGKTYILRFSTIASSIEYISYEID